MRDVILTGFMGTGKTHIGERLAGRYGLRFVDLDAEIERRTGRSVQDWFALEGEAAFRAVEQRVLRDVLTHGHGRVIATGGGTLVTAQAAALPAADQPVICLTCPIETAVARATEQGGRPLLAQGGLQAARELFESRRKAYSRYPQIETDDGRDAVTAIGNHLGLDTVGTLKMDRCDCSRVTVEVGAVAALADALGCMDVSLAIVVTDSRVRALPTVVSALSALGAGLPIAEVVIPPGEEQKTMGTLQALYRACLEARVDRSAVVVGIGGGVVGDVAGMLAATYLRGLRLVLVPTTLLAQVDAAIGGKVGVDLDGAKNMIGAFHPAERVVVDPGLLRSLPDALLSDGMAEVVKTGAILNSALLEEVEQLGHVRGVVGRPDIVRAAIAEKMRVVQEDPYERGIRALLNFGHTVGHAVEAALDFSVSHGQSVAAGMVAEQRLTEERGWSQPGLTERLHQVLDRVGLPARRFAFDVDRAFQYMLQDKKRARGAIRIAVPTEPGKGAVRDIDRVEARAALKLAAEDWT